MKCLIVDDDFISRTKMMAIMENHAICRIAKNGLGALTLFKEALEKNHPFTLIFLDIKMPDMDGTEALLKIRQIEEEMDLPKEKQVKIIMVSSHSDKDYIITCLQAGCNDYIVKPFDLNAIMEKLDKLGIKLKDDLLNGKIDPVKNDNPFLQKWEEKRTKILVVDDDHISRLKMQAIMEDFGECHVAKRGGDALKLFKKAFDGHVPFDLITLDIAMPDMDGTEVLYAIREKENKNKISKQDQVKIIMVTSHSDKGHLMTCIQSGCNDFIVKPFDVNSIIKKIDRIGRGNFPG